MHSTTEPLRSPNILFGINGLTSILTMSRLEKEMSVPITAMSWERSDESVHILHIQGMGFYEGKGQNFLLVDLRTHLL